MPTAQLITRVLHFVASITTPLAVYTIAYGVVPFYGPLPPVHARLFDAPQPKPATVRVSLYLNEINEAHFTPIIDPIRDDNPQDHTSMVLTSAEIDVSGTTQRLELTAQHSEVLDFALKVTEAISTSAEHPCVSSALRWAWLQKLATFEILGPLIRGLAVFFLCHNYVMSSIYVACLALILVAGAVLYGLYYKVKDLRQIVMMSQELAVSKAEAGSHTLDFTLNVTNIFLFSEKKIAPIMHVIGRVLQVVGFITTPLTIYTVASTGIVPLYGPLPSYRVPDFAALNLQPMRVVVPINIITVNTTYLTSTSSYNIGNSFPKHTNFVITTSDFNVPNTIYKLELTANGSNILDFAYNVTSALTTTAETCVWPASFAASGFTD